MSWRDNRPQGNPAYGAQQPRSTARNNTTPGYRGDLDQRESSRRDNDSRRLTPMTATHNAVRQGAGRASQHNAPSILARNKGSKNVKKKGISVWTAKAKAYQALRRFQKPPGKPCLTNLPFEVRDRIFKYALHQTTIIHVPPYFDTIEAIPPMLTVSRELRSQALPVFFSANRFSVTYGQCDNNDIFHSWTKKLGKNVNVLRNLTFVSHDTHVMVRVTLGEGRAAELEVQYTVAATKEHVAAVTMELAALLPKKGGFTLSELQTFFHSLGGKKEEKKADLQLKLGQLELGDTAKGNAKMGS